jgi:RNA polymerase sigma-70 factor (ECF subfamily)
MPLYAVARYKRWLPEDAEDAVQGFLIGLRERNFFEKVDAEVGNLRTYLRSCFENYLRSLVRDETRLKRGGGVEHVSIDMGSAEMNLGVLGAQGMDLTSLYDRQWALALLRHVLGKVEESYAKRGEKEVFESLSPFLRFDADRETTEEIAARLGKTNGTVRQSLSRMRARYREAVVGEIRETVGNEDLAEEELAYLMGIFGG